MTGIEIVLDGDHYRPDDLRRIFEMLESKPEVILIIAETEQYNTRYTVYFETISREDMEHCINQIAAPVNSLWWKLKYGS